MNHKVKGIHQFLQTLGEFRELNRLNISTAFFVYRHNPLLFFFIFGLGDELVYSLNLSS